MVTIGSALYWERMIDDILLPKSHANLFYWPMLISIYHEYQNTGHCLIGKRKTLEGLEHRPYGLVHMVRLFLEIWFNLFRQTLKAKLYLFFG
jgi:hypothetical protein